jgi:hypothetical protein
MKTTTLTIAIEAAADASESRIKEALLADLRIHYAHGDGPSTEDGKPIRIVAIDSGDVVDRIRETTAHIRETADAILGANAAARKKQ